MCSIIVQANAEQINNIRNELKEDEQKLRHYVKLFNDWLNCENHLPKDVDQKLIEAYIRLSKFDIQRAKNKFEKFIISTGKYNDFYNHGHVNPNFFSPYEFHRMAVTLPRLTPEGYRMWAVHIITPDITNFSMDTLSKYLYFSANYMIHEDYHSGIVAICDFRNVGLHFVKRFDLLALKKGFDVCLNILPARVKAVHIINLPSYAEVLYACVSGFLKEKIRKRVILHKSVDGLLDHFDRDLLPKEFGGTLKSLNKLGDDWKEFWTKNQKWLKKTESLKLVGPVPKEKLLGMDECNMEGSFRQLAID